jgi:hypothetical protein
MCLGAWSRLDLVRNADIMGVARLPDISLEVELTEDWDDV